jgi:hypothetical protein
MTLSSRGWGVGRALAAAAAIAWSAGSAVAWNYPGHRIVAQLALAALPSDFPAWARTPENLERIAYLSGEPDRWRDTRVDLLQHFNGLDHQIDLEQLDDAGIDVNTLTPFRYDFVAQFAAGRAAHADRFPPINPELNRDHSRIWPGFLPWAIAEYYAKLQIDLSIVRTFEEFGGRPEEIANARANVVMLMGLMSHYVGDGAQPLHTTVQYNGWIGPNPEGYTTWHGFHSWIDGGFIGKAGITTEELLPRVEIAQPLSVAARADGRDPVFVAVVDYLRAQHELVEPLYRLEKEHKLVGPGPESAEGRAFIDGQLLKGGQMLGSLWLTAWRHPAPTHYLQSELSRRAAPTSP